MSQIYILSKHAPNGMKAVALILKADRNSASVLGCGVAYKLFG